MASIINAATSGGLITTADTSGVLALQTAGTTAVTVDASQNVGIGTASPTTKLELSATQVFVKTTGTTGYSGLYAANTSGNFFCAIDSSTAGQFANGAYSRAIYSSGAYPLDFYTNDVLRVRIESAGAFRVGTTAVLGSSTEIASFKGTRGAAFLSTGGALFFANFVWNDATSGDNLLTTFATDTAGTTRGSVTYNRAGGLIAYNTTSDYRAKDISGPVTGSGALIDSIPVYMGTMKGATQERPMFIAHETPAYAHTGEKDAVDADGNPVYQQMDASALIPVMWAEIQSLRQRLAVLEGA